MIISSEYAGIGLTSANMVEFCPLGHQNGYEVKSEGHSCSMLIPLSGCMRVMCCGGHLSICFCSMHWPEVDRAKRDNLLQLGCGRLQCDR